MRRLLPALVALFAAMAPAAQTVTTGQTLARLLPDALDHPDRLPPDVRPSRLVR